MVRHLTLSMQFSGECSMDLEFSGKVIALTGASRGPCLAIAARLAAEGAAVAIAARSALELADAHVVIEGHGGRCLAYACDLAVAGEAAAFIDSVLGIFGRLDGLVCNGGMSSTGGEGREAWAAGLALNVGHAVEAIEAAAPVMHAVSSVVLLAHAKADEEPWPIASSREALAEAARYLGRALAGQHLRVNQLTPRTPTFADSAVFLLSARSEGITGTAISA
jgi:NAD(P)-dependent dehydrogenase (short-subunit alcohol dehydrogenase family)